MGSSIEVPYRIVKKVKRAVGPPLVRSCDYTLNLGVDLDDVETWTVYPLSKTPPTRIRGVVVRLLDEHGGHVYAVNEEFEFDVSDSQFQAPKAIRAAMGFLYLPRDLVRGYGVDDHTVIDLLLREVVQRREGEVTTVPLYGGVLVTGPIDVIPRDERSD